MIIIRHAWLNLKRNRYSHLKIGGFVLLILLVIFSMLQVYRIANAYFLDYREQAATVVKGVQDLNQTGQAAKLQQTDYEKLKNLSYVKRSQLTGQGIISSTLVQPKEGKSSVTAYSSLSTEHLKENYLSLTMLDNDSLKTLLTAKKEKLQGKLPLKKNTCVISRGLAEANNLKVNETILLGAKGQEQAVEIAGIAEFSTVEWLSSPNTILINWDTETVLQRNIMQPFLNVMFQLTSKKEIKKFVKDFKKMDSFKEYSLISQNWSQELFQSSQDTLDLLLNGLVAALILGIVLIAIVYQHSLKQRQDFYTLHLMGMDRKTLALSSSLESLLLILGVGLSGILISTQLSKWIIGEWLIKFQKNLMEQEPFVDWLLPHVEQVESRATALLLVGICLTILLLLVNLRIARIVHDPLQEVSKR